VLANLLHDD
jgi:predicted component of type VI protein secretion system